MTAYLLSKLCIEAGLPAGVLNIVHGTGPKVGAAIVAHKDIKAISFTGGTKTGEEIARTAGPMFKKLSLELGGKNPNIIFADCDYEEMLTTTVRSSFSNQGEICLCGSRIFVERPIYERFKADFVERVAALKVGDPADPATDVGAIVSKQHFDKIMSYIELAREEGGTILTGGNALSTGSDASSPNDSDDPEIKNPKSKIPRVVHRAHRHRRPPARLPHQSRRDLRPRRDHHAFRHRGRGPRLRQLRPLRPLRHRSGPRTFRELTASPLAARVRYYLDKLLAPPRSPHALRRRKRQRLGREGGFEALRFFTEEKNVCVKL
jgi:aminomuconate-semialdehyde/2-hydroxymuconate-6-semialdehyde dehydrogenase